MPHSKPSEPSEIDQALLGVVQETLAQRPEGSAVLRHRWVEEAGWIIEVKPRGTSAAALSMVFTDGDVVSVTVGNIWFEVYAVKSVEDLDYLRDIAAAVFAGQLEESSRGLTRDRRQRRSVCRGRRADTRRSVRHSRM